MKTLHAIRPQPTLLDFLKTVWPDADPIYNDNGKVEFWIGERIVNTMPPDSWDDWYGRWLDAGAPPDRQAAMRFAV